MDSGKIRLNGTDWNSIPCRVKDLQLKLNLTCGQSFRYRMFKMGFVMILAQCDYIRFQAYGITRYRTKSSL